MTFPAYPTYEDSRIDWLGKKPSHWRLTRLRFVSRLNPSKTEVLESDLSTEVTFLPMDSIGEEGSLSLNQTRRIVDVSNGYSYFREGDVVIAKITPCFENGKGAIMRGLEGGFGFGTTELIVVRPMLHQTSSEFLNWVFRSSSFRARGEAAMYGAGGQKRVPDDFVRDFPISLPPLDEQAAITAFLDRETAKIDAMVGEQQHLIALLQEKRQAVISHTITRGLNPDAPMKNSGIKWLGEVPVNWEVQPISSLLIEPPCYGVLVPDSDPDGVPMLRITDMEEGKARKEQLNTISKNLSDQYIRTIVVSGDLVLSVVGTIGESLIINEELEGINLSRAVARLRPSGACDVKLMRWIFRSAYFNHFLDLTCVGTAQRVLNMGDLANMRIALPPAVEQVAIDKFLTEIVGSLEELIVAAKSASLLLQERRAALISAAVTGKIDVRWTANVLPFPVDRARARGLIAAEIIERSAHQSNFGRVKLQKIAYLAEAHAGVTELKGVYLREAAGPLDREMIREMESKAGELAGVQVEQPGGTGSAVAYQLGDHRGTHRQDLTALLGDRAAKFDKLVEDIGTIDTKGAEAVATLYAVWNDALMDGEVPSDMELALTVLSEWHPEKAKKFRIDELQIWLGWMRRHSLVPTGAGPKTLTGRLFA